MRRALVIATIAALAVARPETYKEKEDFQYSRSSSDDGTKSGFYGAQRGNMGGNYERSHNMDSLAQHQMGGLVRTVEGDLGDGAKQKSGSVFSAANSRGVYGSGHYDLSNVQGRNFQEGTTFGDSQSQSSLSALQAGYGSQSQSYSSAANSAYGSQTRNSRYQGSRYNTGSEQALHANNMQAADNSQSASQYDAAQSSQGSGYNSQSGYQGQVTYDQAGAAYHSSNGYGTSGTRGSNYRLVGASPVRVYVRPGSTIAIPVAAQSYDASQVSSAIYDQNSQNSASSFNQNSINGDAEVLGTYTPKNSAKQYESSYSYRKEWEKHDTVTPASLAVPTVNPYPSNSELYEDTQALGSEQSEARAQRARNIQSSSQYRGYNTKSASSRHQAAYNSHNQEHSSSDDAAAAASLASSSNAYGASANLNSAASSLASSSNTYGGASGNLNSANLNGQVEDFRSKPKSYESSYSYHKSWEHQGDPYVIKPATNGLYTAADSQASQKLTASSLNQASGYRSQQYGSHYHQGQQGHSYDPDCDCDENGHIRVARSYNLGGDRSSNQQSQNTNEGQEYEGQQSQKLEYLGQQPQNLEELGQQNLGDFGQQAQNLQDFSQISQNQDDLGQQSQNLEDLGQQPQNLQNFGQESQNLHDFGQQSQNLEDLGQQSQNLEDLGQQPQNLHDIHLSENVEDQQTQNQWDQQSQTDAGHQKQNTWSTLETQYSHGDKDIAKQSNEMDHSGFDHQLTQGSVFEINQPSLNQPESHTTQANKSKSITHPIFNEHRPDQEKAEDDEKEVPQSYLNNQPAQQVPPFWQPFPPYNKDNENVYAPISPLDMDRGRQEIENWQKYYESHSMAYDHNQHSHDQSAYGSNTWMIQPSYNTGFDTKPMAVSSTYGHYSNPSYPGVGPNPWMLPSPNTPNSSTDIQHSENVHSFMNTQTYITRNNHSTHSTSNVNFPQESGSTSLDNLWDLINEANKKMRSDKGREFSYQENAEDVQTNNEADLMQNFSKNISNNENRIQHSITQGSSTAEPNIRTTTTKQVILHSHDIERGDIEPEKLKPQEEPGRGDISPEDNDGLYASKKPLEILGMSPPANKTPEEIETLSLTKKDNQTSFANSHSTDVEKQINLENYDKQFETELGVLSLNAQKNLEHHSGNDNYWKPQSEIKKTTSTTPKTNYHHELLVNQQSQQNINQQGENTHPQSFNQFESFDQQNYNLDQQNMDHQQADFGQQGENLREEHKMEHQIETFDHQNVNLDQQNKDQHVVSADKHGPVEIQHNTNQQLETLGQQTEDLNQQNYNQFENSGERAEHFGQEHQQSDNFGQQNENLGQEYQQFDNFVQQSEHMGQEHQQFDNFGQQSENLGQEHQPFDGFGQQSEGFQQESLGDFGQHEQLQQESLSSFDHQSENKDHSQKEPQLENWDHQNENLEQQSQSRDLWMPNTEQQTSQVEAFVPPSAYNKEDGAQSHSEPVVEPELVRKEASNVDTPAEPVTEKIGFWNKVGSKFVGAKDKVKSWFSSS